MATLAETDDTTHGSENGAAVAVPRISGKQQMANMRKIVGRVLMPIRKCRPKRTNVIDQLRGNDGEFSVLKLDGSHAVLNLDRLVDAIEGNATVKNVQIHGGLVANLPLDQQHLLWHAIGRLPLLEEIHFKYFLEFPLMLEGLNTVLQNAAGTIRKLTVYDSVLYTRNGDDRLVSLREHKNLKTVFFSQLRIPEGRALDPILASLAEAPNLASLTVRIPRKKKNLIGNDTLRLLAKSESLKVLELRRVVLKDEQIVQLATDLREADSGASKMKEVTIQCDDCLRLPCCEALGSLLRGNDTVTRLEVWGQKVEEEGFVRVIESLKDNKTLKVLHLSHDIGEKGNTALTELLKHNFVMETLYMRSFGDPTMMAQTDYFLKLNATSLRGLQLDVNLTREALTEKLHKHSDDLNHLYFLLRGNPSVF